MRALVVLLAALSWPLAPAAAAEDAQTYPSRLIRFIQPLGPGSPGDIVTRAIADGLGRALGQPTVVENRTGANGIIGMDACAKAAPDGYTICVPSFSQMSTNPVLYNKLPYDPLADLAPVILIGAINSSFAVNAAVPVTSLQELTAYAKSKPPGALNWGSWGIGSFPHLYMAWFQSATGTTFTHVPYRTIGQAMAALVAGEVQVLLNTPGLMQPLQEAGKIRVLAVVSKQRSPLLPEVPLLTELGYDMPLISWVGITVPAGTPPDIVRKLNAEVAKLIADPDFVRRNLAPVSVDPIGGSPEAFGAFLKKDRETTERVAKTANIEKQ
jgi:tripartite-type tricarboxylate transporter receptor subunit TctC